MQPATEPVPTGVTPVLAGHAFFDGERLCFADLSEPPFASLRKRHMSPSTSDGLSPESCPARWAVEQVLSRTLEVPDPFGPAEIGTSGHALLDDLYGLAAPERTPDAAAGLLGGLHERHPGLVVPDNPLLLGVWRDRIAAHVASLFDIEDPRAVHVLARERDMSGVRIDGIAATGFVDRTVRLDDGGCGVDDYKTGKVAKVLRTRPDRHGEQLRLYALMVAERDGVMPTQARVLYVQHGVSRRVSLARADLDRTRRRFAASKAALDGFTRSAAFPARPGPLCGWCPLALVCPAAARAGRDTARSPQARLGPHLGVGRVLAVTPGDHPARHSVSPGAAGTQEGAAMTHLVEDKPWEETSAGGLNPNSYAAIASFGIVGLAVEMLHENAQRVTGASVASTSRLLAWVVGSAQEALTGRNSLQDGANTRLRGALRTTIATMPPPFGGSPQDWQGWADRAVRRCTAIAAAAVDLWATGPVADPWVAVAASTGQPGQPSQPEQSGQTGQPGQPGQPSQRGRAA